MAYSYAYLDFNSIIHFKVKVESQVQPQPELIRDKSLLHTTAKDIWMHVLSTFFSKVLISSWGSGVSFKFLGVQGALMGTIPSFCNPVILFSFFFTFAPRVLIFAFICSRLVIENTQGTSDRETSSVMGVLRCCCGTNSSNNHYLNA